MEVLLALEVDLEILPFDCVQFLVEPDDTGVPVRAFLPAQKERSLVGAVDDAIVWGVAAHESQESGEHVGNMHHLVALDPGLDPAGPADQKRGADASFGRAEIRAIKETSSSASGQVILGAVIS